MNGREKEFKNYGPKKGRKKPGTSSRKDRGKRSPPFEMQYKRKKHKSKKSQGTRGNSKNLASIDYLWRGI